MEKLANLNRNKIVVSLVTRAACALENALLVSDDDIIMSDMVSDTISMIIVDVDNNDRNSALEDFSMALSSLRDVTFENVAEKDNVTFLLSTALQVFNL